jgi:hypothetical protein
MTQLIKSNFSLYHSMCATLDLDSVLEYGTPLDIRNALDAVADLLGPGATVNDIETLRDDNAELKDKADELETELGRYKGFFDDIVDSWQDTLASGRWPCAKPDDNNMLQALRDDMQRGADAIADLDDLKGD